MSYTQLSRRSSLLSRSSEFGALGGDEWGSNSLGLDAGSFTAWGSTPSLPPRRGLPSLGGGLGAYGSAPHAARGARRGALGWLHWKLAVALVAALLMMLAPHFLPGPSAIGRHAAGASAGAVTPAAAAAASAPPQGARAPAVGRWQRKSSASAVPPAAAGAAAGGAARDTFPPYFSFCEDSPAGCGRRGGGVKVISTGLSGAAARGAGGGVILMNAAVARDAFPDWELRIYVEAEGAGKVPDDLMQQLAALGAVLEPVDPATINEIGPDPAAWALLAAGDAGVSRFAVRDLAGSRLLLRDRVALDDWEASGLPFHVMRDHPTRHAGPIIPGLWGAARGPHLPQLRAAMRAKRQPLPAAAGAAGGAGAAAGAAAVNGAAAGAGVADVAAAPLDMAAFLAEALWPAMASGKGGGVLQHDAFSCGESRHAAPGRAGGFLAPRGPGGEWAGMPAGGEGLREESAPACAPPAAPADARAEVVLSPEAGVSTAAGGGAPAPFAVVELKGGGGGASLTGNRGGGGLASSSSVAAAAAGQVLLAAYDVKGAFVDGLTPCGGGAAAPGAPPAPPAAFDRARLYRLGRRRYRKCAAVPPGGVPQHEARPGAAGDLRPGGGDAASEAAAGGGGVFDAAHGGAFGVRAHALLVISDALSGAYGDERFVASEALPALAFALSKVPARGRLLLRDDASTDALMREAAAYLERSGSDHGGGGGGELRTGGRVVVSGADLRAWRTAPWAARHAEGVLHYARRLVVITSGAAPLSALPMLGDHGINAAVAGVPGATALARAAHMLRVAAAAAATHRGSSAAITTAVTAPPECRLVWLGDEEEGVELPEGWESDDVADAAGTDEHLEAVARAGAVVARADAPPLYLPFLRPGAAILWLPRARGGGGGRGGAGVRGGAPALCVAGGAACADLPADRASRAAAITVELSKVRCVVQSEDGEAREVGGAGAGGGGGGGEAWSEERAHAMAQAMLH